MKSVDYNAVLNGKSIDVEVKKANSKKHLWSYIAFINEKKKTK